MAEPQESSSLYSRLQSLPPLARFGVTSALGSFLISTLVASLSVLATHYYALSHGFRLPAEGVPYLTVAIFLATIVFSSLPFLVALSLNMSVVRVFRTVEYLS